MSNELFHLSPSEIVQRLTFNPERPYKRRVLQITHAPPHDLPIVFHTAKSDGITEIDPNCCQSPDYCFDGEVIPVSYVLPKPHVNRVKNASEVWGKHKQEAFDQAQIPYTYLTIKGKNGIDQAQIRMGSTMDQQFLLASKNSGYIFIVQLAERNGKTKHKIITEFISLAPLPVIDSYQFRTSSPIGPGTGGIETHLPIDIPYPKFVGYHPIEEYLATANNSPEKRQVINAANALLSTHPEVTIPDKFKKLYDINRQANRP